MVPLSICLAPIKTIKTIKTTPSNVSSRSICRPWQSPIGARIQFECFNPKRGLISLIYAANPWETQFVQRIWDLHSQRVEATWRNKVNKLRRCSQEHFDKPRVESTWLAWCAVTGAVQCWVSRPSIWSQKEYNKMIKMGDGWWKGWNTTEPLGARANRALNRQIDGESIRISLGADDMFSVWLLLLAVHSL